MNFPKITELVTYINKALTGNDWNTNWQKLINWLTLGQTDIKVKNVETESITNNGTLTQTGTIEADIINADIVNANSFVGDGSNLENIKVADIFPYTPFSVNSAKENFIDSSDSSKLVFLVDDGTLYKPLEVTSAKGKQIKITSINDYDISGLVDGDYYIFVDEQTNGGSVYLKSCKIFRQQETPTGNNGDVWFDTSNEPFVCREKVSSNWYTDEYDKVPVAQINISNGTITITYLPFNSNGANVVYDGKYENIKQRPVVLVKSYRNYKSYYRLYSDGWVEQGNYSNANSSVTFLVAMSNLNYNIKSANPSGYNESPKFYNLSTTGMTIANAGGSGAECWWEISGFIDTSVYNA